MLCAFEKPQPMFLSTTHVNYIVAQSCQVLSMLNSLSLQELDTQYSTEVFSTLQN